MHFLPRGTELFNLKSALLPCGERRGNGPELLLVIRPGLSEVLRDTIKSYVFWSSWWVGWFCAAGSADSFLIIRMKEIDRRPREGNRLYTKRLSPY